MAIANWPLVILQFFSTQIAGSMKPSVYIETSIVSYLRQEPNSQVTMAARQFLTHKWWNLERSEYDLYDPETD